ncbi:5-(carboxyamino)imidazole ribonucleotide mutase [Desulforhabdus amnigena]|nr:5-(carboxyamino)imidazole ribonucleotide mutase [Desulforhabdus amnigena]NLJ29423.1 5-(carboxyamino)imidazole ribonucleotide mutase [Deltaproteobacteria bacterium]
MSQKENVPLVGILMGSDSDLSVMEEAFKALDAFEVSYEVRILSAHRSPEATSAYAQSAADRGIRVLIAGAGWAAHLAGVLAADTVLPVIGVPIDSSPLQGMDSLLATVQMPPGIPVATMAIGKGGARNAALFAVQILALQDPALADKLRAQKRKMADEVVFDKNRKLEEFLAARKPGTMGR